MNDVKISKLYEVQCLMAVRAGPLPITHCSNNRRLLSIVQSQTTKSSSGGGGRKSSSPPVTSAWETASLIEPPFPWGQDGE